MFLILCGKCSCPISKGLKAEKTKNKFSALLRKYQGFDEEATFYLLKQTFTWAKNRSVKQYRELLKFA